MSRDGKSTRARPRDLVKVLVKRDRSARAEQVEAILARRARGLKVERIAAETRMSSDRVESIIMAGRRTGDPRALTDQQAAGVIARGERRSTPKPPPDLVSPPIAAAALVPGASDPALPPRAPARVVRPATFAPEEEFRRAPYIAMLRDASSRVFLTHPDAGCGYAHLADLFEHCASAYPTYVLRDGGGTATLESTDRRFPRYALTRSLTSSHAELCAAG